MRTVASGIAVACAVTAFVAVLAFQAVSSRVTAKSYFTGALESSEVYRRVYDDLLLDPEFAPQVDLLLGGIDVRREQIVPMLKQLVPPQQLEQITNTLIGHLVAHFASGAKLDLSFDITPIVQGVHAIAIDALVRALEAVPVKQSGSYDEFLAELDTLVGALGGSGAIPTAIPAYSIPADQRAEVAARLEQAAALDPADPADVPVIAAIEQAIGNDDVATAIKVSAGSIVERLIGTSIDRLTHNAYVVEIDGRFIFGPDDAVTAKVDRKLALVRSLDRTAGTGRIVAALAFVLSLAALIALQLRNRRVAAQWVGGALVAAGTVAFIGWYVVRGVTTSSLSSVTSAKSLPGSFRHILNDVLASSVASFTPAFWIPAVVTIAAGGALLVATVRRGGIHTA